MIVFCSKCGQKALDTDKFCNECGQKLIKDDNSFNSLTENMKAKSFANILDADNPSLNVNTPSYYSNGIPNNVNYSSNYNNYNSNYVDKKVNYDPNKSLKIAILVCCIILFSMVGVFLFLNRGTLLSSVKGKRTIMIYMIGSDLETKYAAASLDIEEMVNSNADFENVNVLLYTGGAKKWHNESISSDKNSIFKVTSSGIVKLEEYDRKSMGNPDSLVDFLDYSYENYKAEYYSLILWDHGGGPLYGYGIDEYDKRNSMLLLELKNALSDSEFNAENKLEFIGFDACLMSNAEVAFVLSDYADYMVASQELEPGNGWDYSFLKDISTSSTTYDVGKSIVDKYSEFYSGSIAGKGVSLSLLKLSKIESFEKNLNALFKDIDGNLLKEFSNISRTRSDTKTFGKTSSSGYDLVDAYDLIDNLPSKYYEKVNNLKSSIEDLVVYQKTDLADTYGVSLYFPYENKTSVGQKIYLYKNFDFADEYTDFIDNFSSKLTGSRLHDWELEDAVPVSENPGEVSVEIPLEVAENYSKANYIIFEKLEDGYFIPRFKGTDVTLSGNTLSTTVSNKTFVATGNSGEKFYITAMEAEVGTNYTKYLIPAALQNWNDSDIESFEMISVYLQFIVDEENPDGKIGGVIPIITDDAESQLSPKLTLDINDWKLIQLLNYKYQILDESGEYTSEWESSGEVIVIEEEIQNGFNITFEDIDISRDYYCLFTVYDSQGNEYTTNIVKVKEN